MTKSSIIEFQMNRPNFPTEELWKHDGNWVAFSADGKRIVASGPTMEALEDAVQAANEDMQNVWLERVEVRTNLINIGGAEACDTSLSIHA